MFLASIFYVLRELLSPNFKAQESLSHPSVSFDPSKTCGQAYDGTAVMSFGKAGVQAEIKKSFSISYLYSLLLSLSIAASCKL